MIAGRGRRGPASSNPSAVATLEALYEPRYQTKLITAATTRMVFFDTVGDPSLTNTEKQFAIASPKFFEIYEMNWKTDKVCPVADLALLGETGYVVVTVGSKDYVTVPLRLIPAGTFIYGLSDVGAANATGFSYGYGWPGFHERYPLWVHEEVVDPVSRLRQKTGNKLPIVLPPEQKFLATTSWSTAPAALGASRQLMLILWGTLFREVQ